MNARISKDSFHSKKTLETGGQRFDYYDLTVLRHLGEVDRLPFSLKVLLENLLRFEDGDTVTESDIQSVIDWLETRRSDKEIQYRPARVLMQDFTGVPAVVDLAAMRDAMTRAGKSPDSINPQSAVDLVIDHSVMVDVYASEQAFARNVELEMQRNIERYQFLRWGQQALTNFRVVPPGTGICHQVNLEYLGQSVWQDSGVLYPDTLVGTDSHTTMINALGVLGWGVGGIEAEAAMLGQPISMLIPEVIGFHLSGKLHPGVTATDLVLTVTEMLRKKGVVGKFVEFYGPGLDALPLADRATIANMAPEYGATCGFFPIDQETLRYMRLSGRSESLIARVEAYAKANAMWRDSSQPEPLYTETLALALDEVVPSLAGPKRPQDRVPLPEIKTATEDLLALSGLEPEQQIQVDLGKSGEETEGKTFSLTHGDVVIAAITSCTNTSNPSVMLAAGLLAKNAVEKGLQTKPWVKSSLAPGSKVVTRYFEASGLQAYLNKLGFNLVGYGCTTCIGNSGPLLAPIEKAINDANLTVSSVLSGNRNFEGRVHPLVKANWLASPPLVVAFALAGTTCIDLTQEPLGHDSNGQPVYLKDVWPSQEDIAQAMREVKNSLFEQEYADIFAGDDIWQQITINEGNTYQWRPDSTYVRLPPYFDEITQPLKPLKDIENAAILALFGDSITTDHISPAGNIKADSPAGHYLQEQGIDPADFNSYGSRRGNHEVMMRGTFANIRIKNLMLKGKEGGYTIYQPTGEEVSIYDAAMRYKDQNIPLVIFAGKEYGTGSSRDWAAKGTSLLGVKAVLAESFERIHRSNLVGMGVIPVELPEGLLASLSLTGKEKIQLKGIDTLSPGGTLTLGITNEQGQESHYSVKARVDTRTEMAYLKAGGILHYVLRTMISTE
ncbi:aconitate hydratase AcnA [Photobacterium halotolerans]|uniref:Aconitate hydratase n=1 Tax=Photobacterium halotolerans TaxID=265726 RepID=A0A7X4W7U9_9GAMM|nr:aconitate hydratase AcnA [Photobacterium halotolerans]NAW63791.1 aconitate hydratase AcnA [Photobacterium halotolerans]NAW88771.1 aconitate hydratase AcnA [Photobacterium halotolerans]